MHRCRHHIRGLLAVRLLLLVHSHTVYVPEGRPIIPVQAVRKGTGGVLKGLLADL